MELDKEYNQLGPTFQSQTGPLYATVSSACETNADEKTFVIRSGSPSV
jgi:hypothetical protein